MEEKNNFLRTPLAILGVLTAVGIFGYGYFFYTIIAENEKTSLLRGEIELREKEENRSLSERNLIRGTEEERQTLNGYFINSNSIVSFIERLEALGRASNVGMTLSSVDIDKNRKNVLKINLRVSGSFQGIYYLISLIEAMPYEIEVNRFSLSRSAGQTFTKKWEGETSFELLSFISVK